VSSFGTLFAEEQVRDYIKQEFPLQKFKSVKHDLETYNDPSTLPDSFEIALLDDHDVPVATAEVTVKFEIVEGNGPRRIEAEVGEVCVTKIEEVLVPYVKSEIRYWTCPVCDTENQTHIDKGYEEPNCNKCGAELHWSCVTKPTKNEKEERNNV